MKMYANLNEYINFNVCSMMDWQALAQNIGLCIGELGDSVLLSHIENGIVVEYEKENKKVKVKVSKDLKHLIFTGDLNEYMAQDVMAEFAVIDSEGDLVMRDKDGSLFTCDGSRVEYSEGEYSYKKVKGE